MTFDPSDPDDVDRITELAGELMVLFHKALREIAADPSNAQVIAVSALAVADSRMRRAYDDKDRDAHKANPPLRVIHGERQ